MCYYHKCGLLPDVKHTAFYQNGNSSLYREELFSSKGFSGAYTLKYHINMPPAMTGLVEEPTPEFKPWKEFALEPYHFFTEKMPSHGDFIKSRIPLLENEHVRLSIAKISEESSAFYKNSRSWEYLYIHKGEGELLCDLGRLPLKPGDHVVIPKNVIYQLNFENYEQIRVFIVESLDALEFPSHYLNKNGQLMEQAPFCERDIQVPDFVPPKSEAGDYKIYIKRSGKLYCQTVPHHPFDVVGWDGYLYPYSLNIHSFNPVVGRIHLPPPVHAILQTPHMVICNFVPRLFDFHPEAIPAPYFHSNIDSDEVLYYAGGNFMSRSGIEEGSLTLHPAGLIHGPQPGKTEESMGKTTTDELAVMVDTFEPLRPTLHSKDIMDVNYKLSWVEK